MILQDDSASSHHAEQHHGQGMDFIQQSNHSKKSNDTILFTQWPSFRRVTECPRFTWRNVKLCKYLRFHVSVSFFSLSAALLWNHPESSSITSGEMKRVSWRLSVCLSDLRLCNTHTHNKNLSFSFTCPLFPEGQTHLGTFEIDPENKNTDEERTFMGSVYHVTRHWWRPSRECDEMTPAHFHPACLYRRRNRVW